MSEKIRVLIVDDSPLAREMLKNILSSDDKIEVIGMAADGMAAIEKTFVLKPDIITMDLKMPQMSGTEAIAKIMEDAPTPIIVVSTAEAKEVIAALANGAMDFVLIAQKEGLTDIARDLIDKIKIASRVKTVRRVKTRQIDRPVTVRKSNISKVVAIGVSTGGPQALQVLFSSLRPDFAAGILVVQHMSSGFIGGLVEWLKATSGLDIRVAKAGDILRTSEVLFAPDGYNMGIDGDARVTLHEDIRKRAAHIPSVDEMMKSVAESFGCDSIGVIMTGMGNDGVEGIRAIKEAGGRTIAQDEKTSVVFGMNKAAIETGCVDAVVPLDKIAAEIARML